MTEKEVKFKLERTSGNSVSNKELLDDLRLVAKKFDTNVVTQKTYIEFGNFDCSTQIRRFGSWNEALKTANLEIANEINISDEKLFQNLLTLWEHYGRQPRRRELSASLSKISQGPYIRRFGSWGNALESFVEYINSTDNQPNFNIDSPVKNQKRSPRVPLCVFVSKS